MKFTIFTSFHNYIDAADDLFQAILNQTYVHWEWIVSDDFSTNTEIIEKLKYFASMDDRVKIIYPEYKKQYLFNHPLKEATGDILLQIDSDDIPYPKMLEVYKYMFEKFPNVASLGCSSLISKETHNGEIVSAKYIKYNGASNYLEALKNKVTSIVGDARAYRISKSPKDGVYLNGNIPGFSAEDVTKALIIEESGEIMGIPRILHTYTHRYHSSSSPTGGETYRDMEIIGNLIEEANSRVNRENLVSINDYFDVSFRPSKNFYFSDIDRLDGRNKVIEYWDNNITPREKLRLNELYFDHSINYNVALKNPNAVIISIESESDLDLIDILDNRTLSNCTVTITSNVEDKDGVFSKLYSKGLVFWYNFFTYLTVKVSV